MEKNKDRNISDVKQKILRSATDVFNKKGYHGASMNDIALHAGVNKSLLYYYFSSKENLYKDIIKNMFTITENIINQNLENVTDCREKLRRALRGLVKSFSENQQSFSLILYSILGLAPSLEISLEDIMGVSRKPINDILNEGIEKGVFTPMDVNFFSYAVIGMMHFFFRMPFTAGKCYSQDEIYSNTVKLLENGILAGEKI